MTKQEMFEVINANPAFHLATVECAQPRCRAMFLFRTDDNGILFHSGAMKAVHNQIVQNPKVELCFNDLKKVVQIRVAGTLEIVEDNALKDEICARPSRGFLKPWRASGPLEIFYAIFKVYRLCGGIAVWWTMASNFAPKQEVTL
jgi:uncharacterized pyridoxamine 5'-phosphate oxidase family protein